MRRRADPVDGILLLNKPAGITSNRALQTVRRLLNARKAGHTGSLDPAATGMLPLCFGEATKVCAFLLDADKSYRVTARLGEATDTGDADGEITERSVVPELSADEWCDVLRGFCGHGEQVPPMYSALKKDGTRLYELARKGKTVEREPRPIRIDEINLLERAGTRLVMRVSCSKGTYIRVLVEDIARRVGTVAHTVRLHRESLGPFSGEDMLELDAAAGLADEGPGPLRERLLPPDRALPQLPAVNLEPGATEQFCRGQAVQVRVQAEAGLLRVYGPSARFLGVGEHCGAGTVAPRRVFNTEK